MIARMKVGSATLLIAAAALAGCGSKAAEKVDSSLTDGKAIFTAAGCAKCHTLAAAGADGRGAPNLDDAKPGLDVAKRHIEHGGGGMPSFKDALTAEQIDILARYVADNAGR